MHLHEGEACGLRCNGHQLSDEPHHHQVDLASVAQDTAGVCRSVYVDPAGFLVFGRFFVDHAQHYMSVKNQTSADLKTTSRRRFAMRNSGHGAGCWGEVSKTDCNLP